jgi:predicted GIY-YIG superfamily endonuclease
MRTCFLYHLCEPTGEVRYVGISINPEKRLAQHLSNAITGKRTHVYSWIQSLQSRMELPKLAVIKAFDSEEEAARAEILEIQHLKASGANLTNHSEGGDMAMKSSAVKERHLKAVRSESFRQKQSLILKARLARNEIRRSTSIQQLRKPVIVVNRYGKAIRGYPSLTLAAMDCDVSENTLRKRLNEGAHTDCFDETWLWRDRDGEDISFHASILGYVYRDHLEQGL